MTKWMISKTKSSIINIQNVFSGYKTPVKCIKADYLHVVNRILLCWVGAAALASFLGISIDLTFIAGLRRQRIIFLFTSLWAWAATRKAQPCHTMSGQRYNHGSPRNIWRDFTHPDQHTLVLHGSIQVGIHRGSPRLCLSSQTCRGSGWWSTHWRLSSLR